MADRWLLDLNEDSPSGVQLFAAWHDEKYPMCPERRKELNRLKMNDVSKKNTSVSDYVWLPIKFEKGIPSILGMTNRKL